MIIQPKVRGFMCTTAHPAGCAANVQSQIAHVQAGGPIDGGPKRVLVLGASTGYGLASRITAAFGSGAADAGLYCKSLNGDAFSTEMKQQVIDTIKADLGTVDLVVYSLAAPRRQHPISGEIHSSTLKPIGKPVTQRGINTDKELVAEVTLEAASQEDIDNTVAVMGGEDWQMWIDALDEAGVLADGAKTTAYTYIGEKVTWDIYWHGTIGAAKQDLDKRVVDIRSRLAAKGGDARVSVLKAVVTQASAAIPIMPATCPAPDSAGTLPRSPNTGRRQCQAHQRTTNPPDSAPSHPISLLTRPRPWPISSRQSSTPSRSGAPSARAGRLPICNCGSAPSPTRRRAGCLGPHLVDIPTPRQRAVPPLITTCPAQHHRSKSGRASATRAIPRQPEKAMRANAGRRRVPILIPSRFSPDIPASRHATDATRNRCPDPGMARAIHPTALPCQQRPAHRHRVRTAGPRPRSHAQMADSRR